MIRYNFLIIVVAILYSDGHGPNFISVNDYESVSDGTVNIKSVIIDDNNVDNVKVFYRTNSNTDYNYTDMYRVSDGYIADIEKNHEYSEIEYYLLAEDSDGNLSRFPNTGDATTESSNRDNINVSLVSPKDEIEFNDGVPIVIISIWDPDERLDINDIRVSLDGKNITSESSISFDMITYVPKDVITSGDHNIIVSLYNKDRGEYASSSLVFFIKEKPVELADVRSEFFAKFNPSASITWDTDYDEKLVDRGDTRPEDTHKFNAKIKFKLLGFDVSGSRSYNTHILDNEARLDLASRQDPNRYKLSANSKYLDYTFGDLSPQFSDFTLKGTRVRGNHVRLKLGKFETFLIHGESREMLESTTNSVGVSDTSFWSAYRDDIWNHNDINENGIIDKIENSISIEEACLFNEYTWNSADGLCMDSNVDVSDSICSSMDSGNYVWDDSVSICFNDLNNDGVFDRYGDFAEDFTDCGYGPDNVWVCNDQDGWDDSYGNGVWNDAEEEIKITQSECELNDLDLVWDSASSICFNDIDSNNELGDGEQVFIDKEQCELGGFTWSATEDGICFDDINENGLYDYREEFEDSIAPTLDGYLLSDPTTWEFKNHGKGTPKRVVSGLRIQGNPLKNLKIGLSAIKAYDDNSLGIDPLFINQYQMLGNLSIGLDMELRLNKNRTILKAEHAFSASNNTLSSDTLLTSMIENDSKMVNNLESLERFLGYNITDDIILGVSDGRGLSIPFPTGNDAWSDDEIFTDCGYGPTGQWMCEDDESWEQDDDWDYGNGVYDTPEREIDIQADCELNDYVWNSLDSVCMNGDEDISNSICSNLDGGEYIWDDKVNICFEDYNTDGIFNRSEFFIDNPINDLDIFSYFFKDIIGRGAYQVSFSTPIPVKNIKMDYSFEIKRVPSNYLSLGSSSIRSDFFGIKTGTKIKVWKDQISFNMSYDRNNDNVNGRNAETKYLDITKESECLDENLNWENSDPISDNHFCFNDDGNGKWDDAAKLKSSTTTSSTINSGLGLNFPNLPVVNYSFKFMSRYGININGSDTTINNSTLSHTIAPSYKFGLGSMNININGNILYMIYSDLLNQASTSNDFTSLTSSINLGLGFKLPLSISAGVGQSSNIPDQSASSQMRTDFIIYNGKIGYKFFNKKLSANIGGSYVIGNQDPVDGEGGIDTKKLTLKLSTQLKLNKNISCSFNFDCVDLKDAISPEKNLELFEELKGKVKLSINL